MSDLPYLEGYAGETLDTLIRLDGKYSSQSLVAAVEEALDQKASRIGGVDLLTKEERVVLAVEALEREVNNGGYDQFFSNTSSQFVTSIVSALHSIKRGDLAQLTQRAIDISQSPENDGADALDELDSEYYHIAGDLSEALFEFIKQAQKHITLP